MKELELPNGFDLSDAIPFFKDISQTDIENLRLQCQYILLQRNETLLRKGDSSKALYIVISGSLMATLDDHKQFLGRIRENETVGEIEVLSGGQCTADVTAEEDTYLIKVPQQVLLDLTQNNPQVIQHLVQVILHRLRKNQLKRVLTNFFGPFDEETFRYIEQKTEWLHLKRGATLFEENDSGDSFFVVVTGLLRATVTSKQKDRILGDIFAGECVGEMAFFSNQPRSAKVFALRASEVVKITRSIFERILEKYPQIVMPITQNLIERLRAHTGKREHKHRISLAVFPISDDVATGEFCNRLTQSLSHFDSCLHLDKTICDKLLIAPPESEETSKFTPFWFVFSTWLEKQESDYQIVVHEVDTKNKFWTKCCLEHADQIILLANAQNSPKVLEIENNYINKKHYQDIDKILVLIHPNGDELPSKTREWLINRDVTRHHHVRWDNDGDFDRMARFITKNTISLVLSGGGARGNAHIGVIKAFVEAGVSIDVIGGTSMGAAIAGLHAAGMPSDDMDHFNDIEFVKVKKKPFEEYTLPIVSLVKGDRVEGLYKRMYNYIIEDLWIPYFAVSCNLSTGKLMVHQEGPLWDTIRATTAIPGVLPPFIKDNQFYIDGGVLDNMPVTVARQLYGGWIVAVEVGDEQQFISEIGSKAPSAWKILWHKISPFRKPLKFPSILNFITRTLAVNSLVNREKALKETDLFLQPPVTEYSFLDFKQARNLSRIGYEYTKEVLQKSGLPFIN